MRFPHPNMHPILLSSSTAQDHRAQTGARAEHLPCSEHRHHQHHQPAPFICIYRVRPIVGFPAGRCVLWRLAITGLPLLVWTPGPMVFQGQRPAHMHACRAGDSATLCLGERGARCDGDGTTKEIKRRKGRETKKIRDGRNKQFQTTTDLASLLTLRLAPSRAFAVATTTGSFSLGSAVCVLRTAVPFHPFSGMSGLTSLPFFIIFFVCCSLLPPVIYRPMSPPALPDMVWFWRCGGDGVLFLTLSLLVVITSARRPSFVSVFPLAATSDTTY